MVIDWIWRFCNIDFENVLVLNDWRIVVIVPLYYGKEKEALMQEI